VLRPLAVLIGTRPAHDGGGISSAGAGASAATHVALRPQGRGYTMEF
jgi:hypothetical protein